MKLADRIWDHFYLNPATWLLVVLLIVVVYRNHQLEGQLDTICQVINVSALAPDSPRVPRENVQSICADRLHTGNIPED